MSGVRLIIRDVICGGRPCSLNVLAGIFLTAPNSIRQGSGGLISKSIALGVELIRQHSRNLIAVNGAAAPISQNVFASFLEATAPEWLPNNDCNVSMESVWDAAFSILNEYSRISSLSGVGCVSLAIVIATAVHSSLEWRTFVFEKIWRWISQNLDSCDPPNMVGLVYLTIVVVESGERWCPDVNEQIGSIAMHLCSKFKRAPLHVDDVLAFAIGGIAHNQHFNSKIRCNCVTALLAWFGNLDSTTQGHLTTTSPVCKWMSQFLVYFRK
eukprot:c20406_g1_i1.p1 GENE.c20406_g1_i1~~c20406_g1_i1.p1  ORF type:complete len:269 (-),score=61.70 c20406_g1_i1:15-821(-)